MKASLRLLTLCLTVTLLGIRGHVRADDLQFQLSLPLQGTAENSLQQLGSILKTIGAKFPSDTLPEGLISATMGDGKQIMILHVGDPQANTSSIFVQCVVVQGGAEALCQDIARRYRQQ